MNYIFFDLEWNNSYDYKLKQGFNEIVEIGAIKLNKQFEVIDSFKQMISLQVSNKLSSHFSELTKITIEEINNNGVPFFEAFSKFSDWCGNKNENVFLSWSNSDLYALASNFKRFNKSANVQFIKYYADAQAYCMNQVSNKQNYENNQISLLNFAHLVKIKFDDNDLHRALEDCYLTYLCFEKVFNEHNFSNYVKHCDESFFERLIFKSKPIKKKIYKDFNLDKVKLICPYCNSSVNTVSKFELLNSSFKNFGVCSGCKKNFWVYVSAKETYDGIKVKQKFVKPNKNRAKKIISKN